MGSSSALGAPSRKARRAAAWSSCRRSSASTRTSARSPTASPPTAISPSRRRSSIAANAISRLTTGRRDSRAGAGWPRRSADIAAAVEAAKAGGKVGVVGYCLGGTLAWLAAAKVGGLAAAVGYYGSGVPTLGELKPRAPVMLHFGELDAHIPLDGVRGFAAAHPDTPVFTYPTGGHAFNRYGNAAYGAPSATLARQRTMAFFASKLG